MPHRIRTSDWFRPLLAVLLQVVAWAFVLAVLGGIGAYGLMIYFKLKGF